MDELGTPEGRYLKIVIDDDIHPKEYIFWKFHLDNFISSVSGMGGQEGEFLVDIGGSWLEILSAELSFMLWMMFLT